MRSTSTTQSRSGASTDPSRAQGVTLLYLIKQVELAVRVQLDTVIRDEGLTVAQYTALTVLERRPRMTSAQLAKSSFVRAQTMSAVTAELESRGLVARQQDPSHQRRQLLSVTPEGRTILRRLRPRVTKIEERMVSSMSDMEVARLREALQGCRVALGGERTH